MVLVRSLYFYLNIFFLYTNIRKKKKCFTQLSCKKKTVLFVWYSKTSYHICIPSSPHTIATAHASKVLFEFPNKGMMRIEYFPLFVRVHSKWDLKMCDTWRMILRKIRVMNDCVCTRVFSHIILFNIFSYII